MEIGLNDFSKIPRRMSISDSKMKKYAPNGQTVTIEQAKYEINESTKNSYQEELLLVTNKMAQDLEILREFSDCERELWKKDREVSSIEKENLINEISDKNTQLQISKNEYSNLKDENKSLMLKIEQLNALLIDSKNPKCSKGFSNNVYTKLKMEVFANKLAALQASENLRIVKKFCVDNTTIVFNRSKIFDANQTRAISIIDI